MKKNCSVLLLLILLISCSNNLNTPGQIETRNHAVPGASTAITTMPVQPHTPPSPPAYPYPEPVLLASPGNEKIETTLSPYPYPIPGAVQIISSSTPSPTATPTFSPVKKPPIIPPFLSSLRIAYLSRNQLWLWHEGKSGHLADVEQGTNQVDMSDDGRLIAYSNGDKLWVIGSDGSGKKILIDASSLELNRSPDDETYIASIDWIPGQHILLFNTSIRVAYGYQSPDDLHQIDAETGDYTALLQPEKGGLFVVSPNGKYAAVSSPSEIKIYEILSKRWYLALRYDQVMIPSETGFLASPEWSQDSKSLVVAIPSANFNYDTNSNIKIWKLIIGQIEPSLLSKIESSHSLNYSISPDHTKIAYASFQNLDGSLYSIQEIHLANIDGSGDEIYITGRYFLRGWLPDSERFLLESDNALFLGQIDAQPFSFLGSPIKIFWLDNNTAIYWDGAGGKSEVRLGFLDGSYMTLVGPVDETEHPMYFDFSRE